MVLRVIHLLKIVSLPLSLSSFSLPFCSKIPKRPARVNRAPVQRNFRRGKQEPIFILETRADRSNHSETSLFFFFFFFTTTVSFSFTSTNSSTTLAGTVKRPNRRVVRKISANREVEEKVNRRGVPGAASRVKA